MPLPHSPCSMTEWFPAECPSPCAALYYTKCDSGWEARIISRNFCISHMRGLTGSHGGAIMALLQGVVKFHTGGDAAFRFRKVDESANGAEKRRRTGQNPVPTVKSGWKKQAASAFCLQCNAPPLFRKRGRFSPETIILCGAMPRERRFL